MDKEKAVTGKDDNSVIVSCARCIYYIMDTSIDNNKYCSSPNGCPPMEGDTE